MVVTREAPRIHPLEMIIYGDPGHLSNRVNDVSNKYLKNPQNILCDRQTCNVGY